MVLVLVKCGKINDVQAAGSAVTAVLKRLFQLLRKAVTTIMKNLSQLSGKTVCFGQKQKGQMGDFRLLGEVIQHLLYGFG